MRLFSRLLYFDDRPDPGGAAWNMAMDEAILLSVRQPTLRVYAWERPAVSFGYFIAASAARASCGQGMELVRRWTGGGIVLHGSDVTWSLAVPAADPFFKTKPVSSYMAINGQCAAVLRALGAAVEQIPETVPAPDQGLCFTQPAPGDLVVHGRKIVGAGQRRTRQGLLHQASVSGITVPPDFPAELARLLANEVEPWRPGAEIRKLAAELAAARYDNPGWRERCWERV